MSKRATVNYDDVTINDIYTALYVLDALAVELTAHAKRRIIRVAKNEAWDAIVEAIEDQHTGYLCSIHRLQFELKHWRKRRLKSAQRSLPTRP